MTSRSSRTRVGRMRQLCSSVIVHGEQFTEDEFVARYAIDNGISTNTVKLYVSELLDAGILGRQDGHLIVLKQFGKVW